MSTEVLPALRSQPKLHLEGFIYTLKRSNKNLSQVWRCERSDCRCTVTTLGGDVVNKPTDPNHETQPQETEIRRFQTERKDRSK